MAKMSDILSNKKKKKTEDKNNNKSSYETYESEWTKKTLEKFNNGEDIAPFISTKPKTATTIKTTTTKKNNSLFSDGYDFGDISNTILNGLFGKKETKVDNIAPVKSTTAGTINTEGYKDLGRQVGDYTSNNYSNIGKYEVYSKDGKYYYYDTNKNKYVEFTGNEQYLTSSETLKKEAELAKKEGRTYNTTLSVADQLKLDDTDLTKEEYDSYSKSLQRQAEDKAEDYNRKYQVNYSGAGLKGSLGETKRLFSNLGKNIDEEIVEPVRDVKENYDYGKKTEQLMKEAYKKMVGEENNYDSLKKEVETYSKFNQDIVENGNYLDQSLQSLPNQVGGFIAGTEGGGIGSIAGGILGGVVGKATGLGIGKGATLGAKYLGGAGYVAGQSQYTYELEAGGQYMALLDLGVPEDIAKKEAKKTGIINAAIESGESILDLISLGQLGKVKSALVNNLVKEYGEDTVGNWVGTTVLRNALSEGAEEAAQETSSILSEKRATEEAGIERDSSGDLERIKESAIVGALGGFLSSGATTVIGGVSKTALNTIKNNKGQTINEAVTEQINNIEKETGPLDTATKEQLITEAEQEVINQVENASNTEVNNDIAPINNNEIQNNVETIQENNNQTQNNVNEALKRTNFKYEINDTDSEFKKAAYESATKVMNDTEEAHKFVDVVAKIAEEKQTNYRFTNNVELKKEGFNFKGKTINGLVTDNGEVLINVDSKKALNAVLGHETTHLLEGTKEYKALKDMAVEYAKTTGEYQTRLDKLTQLYEGKNANVEKELVADIVGDYLFTNEKFVNDLSIQKPTVFQKIKSLIDDLVVKFKGTAEEKQLRQLQKTFEKAYKQNASNTEVEGNKYSISNEGLKKIADEFGGGKNYWEANLYDKDLNGAIYYLKKQESFKNKFKENNNIKIDPVYKDIKMRFSGNENENVKNFVIDNDITVQKLANDSELFNKFIDLERESLKEKYNIDDSEANDMLSQWIDYFDRQKGFNETIWALLRFENDFENIKSGATQEIDNIETSKKERDLVDNNPEYEKFVRKYAEPLFGEKVIYDTDEVMEEAKFNHGTTDNFEVGAYMTTDGSLLDFNYGGYRDDHRTISAFDLDMTEFMDYGAIRMQPETPGFEMQVEPTSEQYSKLYDYIDYLKSTRKDTDTIKIDIDKKGFYDSNSYNMNTSTSKIINDLKEYWRTGSFPKQSEFAQFYSISDTDSEGRTLSKEQQEYFKDSKVVDEKGNLKVLYHGSNVTDITIFKKDKFGNVGINYLTDDSDIADTYRNNKGRRYEFYSNIKNPLIIDGNGKNWNDILVGDNPKSERMYNSLTNEEKTFLTDLAKKMNDMYSNERSARENAIEGFYQRLNAYDENLYDKLTEESSIREKLYDTAINEWSESYVKDLLGKRKSTDTLVKEAYDSGQYDGVVFKNIVDRGAYSHKAIGRKVSNVYVTFNPNQIKNVDNLNPTSNEDIRKSLSNNNEDIAPIGNYNVKGEDVKLQNDIAPIKQELSNLTNELKQTVKDTKKELKTLTKQINEVKTSIEETKAITEADLPMLEQQYKESFENIEVPIEVASNTQQNVEIPTFKENVSEEDPFMRAVENQKKRHEKKQQVKLENDEYTRNNNVKTKKKTSLKDKTINALDTFQEQFINRNRYQDKLSKQTGNAEIKYKGDRVNNITGEVGGDIFTAQTDNYGNVIGKSLDAPFEAARKEGIDTYFENYLKHQSNLERHRQNKGSKTVSAKTSNDYVQAYENKYPQFKEWSKDVYTYNQNLLNNAVNNGLITEDFRDLLTSMYGKYVPFYENTQESEPSVYMPIDEIKTSKPIKRAIGGSSSNLLGVEKAMIQQTYAYKNSIAKNDLYKEIGKSIGKNVEVGADVRTSATDMQSTLYADENGKFLTYYENGEQKTIQIDDNLYNELSRTLEKQIKDIEEKYSLITKPLQKISQIRGQILTTYSPSFVVSNPIKDIGDALFNTKYFGKYLKNVITQSTITDSVKGTQVNEYATQFKELTGQDITSVKDATTLKGKAKAIYKNYQAGTMWNRFIATYGSNAASMEFTDSGIDVKKKNLKFLNGIETANNYMEVMFRYPEFKSTLEKGGSFTEALYNAREVTTNFGRGGTIAKAINRNGATFFNTSIQGLDKFRRNLSFENGARGFVGAVAKATVLGIAPALLNDMLFGMGDDKDEEYEALPSYIKDNYYLFKTGEGEFIRIPKGRMIAVLGSTARRTLEAINGEENAFEGYLKNVGDQVGSTNPLKENIFSPLIQAYGSENGEAWYGGDLVPSRLQNKPKAEQYDESTDAFSKWLGEQLNISPYKINYVIDQYTGGIGDILLPTITEEAKSDGTLLAPIKDKFVVNSTDDNKYVGELYDKSEELTKKANSTAATDGDVLRSKYIYNIKSQMGELYGAKREIQNDSSLTKEEKYTQTKAIQEAINDLAKYGLDSYSTSEVKSNYASVGEIDYYKTSEGDWYSVNEEEAADLNSMGMTSEEKNSYFKAKTSIYDIKDMYSDLLDNASEDEKSSLYTNQKREIISEVMNSNLNDEEKAYLYDKYYADTDKLNVILNTNIPMDTYLDLEYKNYSADKDENGKTINGSKKEKIMNYIESSGLDYNQKIILHKTYYPADDSYNYEIADYVFNNVEAYEDIINILETLGYTIGEDGTVYWD